MCEKHVGMQWAYEDFSKATIDCGLPQPAFDHYTSMVDNLYCSPQTLTCLEEKCPDCGIGRLKSFFDLENARDVQCSFRVIENDKDNHKVVNVKTGTITDV